MSRYIVADLFLPSIGAGVEGGRTHLPREEPVRIDAQQGLRHRHRDHHVAIAVLGLPGTLPVLNRGAEVAFRALDDHRKADSPIGTFRRYAIEPGRPGINPA